MNNQVFLTPGPTEIHPLVPKFLNDALSQHIPSISHRSKEFEKIFLSCADSVRELLGAPPSFHVFFLGSATEAMERIIQNCALAHSFHFVNGAFSERFLQTAQELGLKTSECKAEYGKSFDFKSAKIPDDVELICATHNETSTGVMLNPADLKELKKRYPNKILAVDIVSSAPYPRLSFAHTDAAFFSVQKCFGLPAGLGVLLVNEACLNKSAKILESGRSTGSYHNFSTLLSFGKKNQTPATPNVLGIYLLAKVAEHYCRQGIEKIRRETEEKAKYIYDFLDSGSPYSAFVTERSARSSTVIAAATPDNSAACIRRLADSGLHVGSGYAGFKDKHIRIANFPMHSSAMIQELVGLLQSSA